MLDSEHILEVAKPFCLQSSALPAFPKHFISGVVRTARLPSWVSPSLENISQPLLFAQFPSAGPRGSPHEPRGTRCRVFSAQHYTVITICSSGGRPKTVCSGTSSRNVQCMLEVWVQCIEAADSCSSTSPSDDVPSSESVAYTKHLRK